MKPIINALAVTVAVTFCLSARAQKGSEVDPASMNAPASKRPSNPDHLEPIPAYDPDGYDQAVFRSLLGIANADAWMICTPSFSPEYAVILRRSNKSDDPCDRRVGSLRWIVEYVEAKSQIWRWKELEEGGMELDIKVTEDLNKERMAISPEFAAAILSTWESVLRKTRYPDMGYRGLDGSTYHFYCRPQLFGEIWSPDTGVPRMMTDLGHELCAAVKTNGEDRRMHIEKCLELVDDIRSITGEPKP